MPNPKSIVYKYHDRYICDFCSSYEATSKKGLDLHIKYTHGIEKATQGLTAYVCSFCKKEFTKNTNLLNHFKKMHQV